MGDDLGEIREVASGVAEPLNVPGANDQVDGVPGLNGNGLRKGRRGQGKRGNGNKQRGAEPHGSKSCTTASSPLYSCGGHVWPLGH